MQSYLPLLIIPGFLLFFALFGSAVCFLLAQMSGWATLAREYKSTKGGRGGLFYGQSGEMNGVRYGTALTVGVSEEGLFLDVLFLFRPGHAPLLLPWSQMSDFRTGKSRFRTGCTTRITSGNGTVDLTLYNRRLADRIQLQAAAVSPPAAR